MPSKKKGRAPGRGSAVDPGMGTESLEPGTQTAGASSSSSSAAKATPEAAAAAPGKLQSPPRAQELCHAEFDPDRAGNQASASSAAAPDTPAFASEEDALADNYEDALEELEKSSNPDGKSGQAEDPVAALLARDPALQVPTPARADWNAEAEALRKLVEDAEASEEEKVRVLHEALTQRVDDLRGLEEHRTAVERCLEELVKERDRCRKETQAALAAKSKLEDSCRELQQLKVNITQENKKIVEDEKNRQNELNDKFQAAMKDVNEKMNAETEIREHFIKENDELRTKLDKFTETYEEQERQLAEQCAVRGKEMSAAQERLREYEGKSVESKANAAVLERKNKALQKTTVALRAELQSILGKFDEFHESVNGSSQKHGECKSEIDGLSARLKELEEENTELKGNVRVNELAKEKESAQKQRDALERLCSNLQKEIDTIRERLAGALGKKGGG